MVPRPFGRKCKSPLRWLAFLAAPCWTGTVAIRAAEPAAKTGQAQASVGPVVDSDSPGTKLHLTAADIQKAEGKYSLLLRDYRQRYRMTRMTRDEGELRRRMLALAAEVGPLLAKQSPEESPVWLELLQNAYAVGGDASAAEEVLERRYEALAKALPGEEAVLKALDEAVIATAQRQYEIADALYDVALKHTKTQANRFKAVMGRGRLISEMFDMDTAVTYYRDMVTQYRESEPELAREAHFRAAEEYYRHQQLDRATDTLLEIEAMYPNTPEAEKARHARRGWEKGPGE